MGSSESARVRSDAGAGESTSAVIGVIEIGNGETGPPAVAPRKSGRLSYTNRITWASVG